MKYLSLIPHWIENNEVFSSSFFDKINPADGSMLAKVSRGGKKEVDQAVTSALSAFDNWSNASVIARSEILRNATLLMQDKKEEIAEIVHLETGKSMKDARAEVGGAIELGFFMAGEGRRFYGKTTASAMPNRTAMTIRQPIGVCALIVPFNTPIANVAWKAFPALLCGNTVVMKASKDIPYTPIWFAKILKEVGLPSGVFNVIQGFGEEAGVALVEDTRIDLISFTGSTDTGKYIYQIAGGRLARISLELGGKNALIVCDDADIVHALDCAVLSAFSNAGQRCASGSRIIVFEKFYERFKKSLIEKTKKLKIGTSDTDDYGPVISENQLTVMLKTVDNSKKQGATALTGGFRLEDKDHKKGFYMAPTVLENVTSKDEISSCELFGPITTLYTVKNFNEAMQVMNDSPYGLTAAIHTANMHRVQEFIQRSRVGVVSINGPTYGSEPHIPFGGLKQSGNGHREPGTEALDVYSEWKTIYIKHDPERV